MDQIKDRIRMVEEGYYTPKDLILELQL